MTTDLISFFRFQFSFHSLFINQLIKTIQQELIINFSSVGDFQNINKYNFFLFLFFNSNLVFISIFSVLKSIKFFV